jgi:hypothetical protein
MGQCPSTFRSMGGACVSDCPTEKGFEFQMPGGQPRCTYKDQPNFFVNLSPVQAYFRGNQPPIPNLTVEGLKDVDALLYAAYKKEQDRVVQETAILYEKIDKDKKLKDAFNRLQDAENARDKAPDAYQQARSNYYTLKDGEAWKEREKERLMKAEVEPLAQKFVDIKSKAVQQYQSQRKTVDVVNGLKDNVLSLKDEMKYAADTFQEQLTKVKEAINQERRGRATETKVSIWDWLDTILNITIVGSLLYVIYLLYKKFAARPPQPTSAVFVRG